MEEGLPQPPKEGILKPTTKFSPVLNIALKPLVDEKNLAIILGRSSGAHRRSGMRNLLDLGVVTEKQGVGENLYGYKVFMDAEFPHVIFICGKRGSGKSYTLGIVAEELASQNTGIGVVIIDPIGIFWSMKQANKNRPEKTILKKFGLEPKAFENVRVLAPVGFYEDMAKTCDGPFSICPKDLNAEDWCGMFDIDRFKAQGLLIGDVIEKVRRGYKAKLGQKIVTVPGTKNFSLGDMVQCIQYDISINSKEEGYAPPTKRSVTARFKAASRWGIFATEGTMIGEVSLPDQVTVVDVSHPKLGDARRSLVVGILARKILENRIETSRSQDAQAMGLDVNVKTNIPVTWLLIDEAHLMIPHSGQSVASRALIEYAKLGRKPGCGLVLATQRPAATNDDILSQVDLLIGHNLALEDDMHALRRRMPSKLPTAIAESDFIRALPVGTGIIADQKTQERTLVIQFRPRYTHHSGKAAKPTGVLVRAREEEEEPIAAEGGIIDDTPKIYRPTFVLALEEDEDFLPDEPEDDEEAEWDEDEEGEEEEAEVEEEKREYLPGNTYLIYADDQDEYFFQFMKHLKAKEAPGICLSRTHPDKLEQRYPQLETDFFWLSKSTGEACVSPSNLQAVMSTINQYMKENEDSTILLDGLEYLISNTDFQKVLALIQGLNEKVVLNKGLLMIPVDPTSLDEKERGVLEKEVDYVINLGPEIIDPKEKLRRDLENLTKDRLEDLCRERGLKRSGSKEVLIDRLTGAPDEIPMVEQKTHDEIKAKLQEAMDGKLLKLKEKKEKEYQKRMEQMERDRKRMEQEEQKQLRDAQRQMEAEARKLERLRLQMEKEKEKEDEKKRREKEEAEDRKIKEKHQKELREQEEKLAQYKKEVEDLKKQQKEAAKKRVMIEAQKKKEAAARQKRLEVEAKARKKEEEQRTKMKEKAQRERLKQKEASRKQKEKERAKREAAMTKAQLLKEKEVEKRVKDRGGAQAFTIKNKVSAFNAAKTAEKEVRTTLLGKPKETLGGVGPKYVELLRFRVRAVSGFTIFAKETTMYLVFDNYSQEFVTGFKKCLLRTKGADHLIGLTHNQIRVMLTLGRWGTSAEKASKKSEVSPGDSKRALGQLVKKNLAKTKYVKSDDETYYYPTFKRDDLERSDVLDKENCLPRAGPTEPSHPILTKGLKPKEVWTFIENFLPEVDYVDVEYIYYPYFVGTLKGKGGKRYMFVDAVTGTLDKDLSHL